jgi:hypothetical protein
VNMVSRASKMIQHGVSSMNGMLDITSQDKVERFQSRTQESRRLEALVLDSKTVGGLEESPFEFCIEELLPETRWAYCLA